MLAHCQRAAHKRYASNLGVNDVIPATPFRSKNLSPATSEDDKKQFYKKVHSNVITKLIDNFLSPTGYSNLML